MLPEGQIILKGMKRTAGLRKSSVTLPTAPLATEGTLNAARTRVVRFWTTLSTSRECAVQVEAVEEQLVIRFLYSTHLL